MRGLGLMIVFLLLCGVLKAQDMLQHPKKTYVAADGKVYLNKALPTYFYISTSANPEAPKFLLKSETSTKYTNPMYFDTEGKNTLRSPSAVDTATRQVIMPKRDVEYQIYIDSKPPQTKIIFEKQNTLFNKGNNTFTNKLEVAFEATDALSGVENVYVSIDGMAYAPYQRKLTFNDEREYLIKYYGVDHTGNVESMHEKRISLDKTPPVSKLKIAGVEYEQVLPANTLLSIEATDQISGIRQIYISIDDSVFRPYTAKINTSQLAQGDHKLWYYAVDNVNNKENVTLYAFYVDKTPPQVIEEIQGKTFIANGKEFSAGTSKLKITSFDNKSGVKEIFYSINNAPFIKYEKPVILTDYKGTLLVKSYATDNVGNSSVGNISNAKTRNIPYIDLSAPWVGHTFKGPKFLNRDTLFINQNTAIVLEARDTESGVQKIEYQTDSSDLINYAESFLLNTEGFHRISVYGYDFTENLTRQEFSVVVDNTGPEIFERFSSVSLGMVQSDNKEVIQYPAQTVIFLSATDEKSGFHSIVYELNSNKTQPYLGEIRGFIAGKTNTLKVRATDNLGNITEKIIEFYIR